MSIAGTGARIISHALIFAAAILIFVLGTGIGLQVNSTVGSVMWITAIVLGLSNCVLIALWLLVRHPR